MNRDRNKKVEPTIAPDTWFSVRQAAQYMSCTPKYVKRLCQARRIPYAELGHRYVLKREDLDTFVESLKKPILSVYNESKLGRVTCVGPPFSQEGGGDT